MALALKEAYADGLDIEETMEQILCYLQSLDESPLNNLKYFALDA